MSQERTTLEDLRREMDEIRNTLEELHQCLHGSEGRLGFLQKLNIIWQVLYVWPVCTISAGLGVVGTLLIQRWVT